MINYKSKIIQKYFDENIDNYMEKQLFNANRYYAETNLGMLMSEELNEKPEDYYKKLVDRWNWHNSFYESLLEPAILDIIKKSEKELSPKEIEQIKNIYNTCTKVDEATLVMSGSIKKYLDYWVNSITVWDENMTNNEANQSLITPAKETFFAQYQIDHLLYIYYKNQNSEKAKEKEKEIISKYHAGDESLFINRFKRQFSKDMNKSCEELQADIKKYQIPDEVKIKHQYFMIEHPDRKAIDNIIIYDNIYEKLIGSNLIGLSGFLLRTQVLKYLDESCVLKNYGYIYEFSNEVIDDSLDKLINERNNFMEKDVRVYKQRGDTCAIACLMMALEYFGVMEKANWYDEKRLYRVYRSNYMAGTPFAALAYHFAKNNINTEIIHSEKNLFKNDKGLIDSETFESAMDEYKDLLKLAEENGASIKNGVDINSDTIINKLKEGNLVILAGEISDVFHAVLACGYDKDEIILCDPLYKNKVRKKKEEIDSFINTSIGKWMISINNMNKRKDLLNSLDTFNSTADKLLKKESKKTKKYERN